MSSISQHQQYLLQQMHSHNPHKPPYGGTGPVGTAQILPKTPNDIYGFAQKAMLHSIFEKGPGVVGTATSIQGGIGTAGGGGFKSRHATPYIG